MGELPDYFDVIVIGTGMPECIVAAAAARVGKTVLHLERNGYYGGDWASFSFDKFLEWIEETKDSAGSSEEDPVSSASSLPLDPENETIVDCCLDPKKFSNLSVKCCVQEVPNPPECLSSEVALSENEGGGSSSSDENPSSGAPTHQEWTVSQFIENRRKFNIDLSPKLLFSRGSLVELLISSNIARYAEFQCVNRVLTYINGHIEQVPCSRADVFSTKNVTVVEKRMLMKFLSSCVNLDENEGNEEPFSQYLRAKKLTANVEHYILHAIAMVDSSCSTLKGLQATQKFLLSLGRYGKSPFLCTCYGSAELPQCFCRLCAVYGGIYCLKKKVEALVFTDRCCGILSESQRINCQWVVMESSLAPKQFLPSVMPRKISKAVLITDKSLYPSEKLENTLLRVPSGPDRAATTVLEFSSKSFVCPEDLFLVYLVCPSSHATAEEDLTPICDLLFCWNSAACLDDSKPRILWCAFFNQDDTTTCDLTSNAPKGLFLTSSPDAELDYENAVREAQDIFSQMWPGEEFLPRAPDPEDILFEGSNDIGNGSEKLENDAEKVDFVEENQ